MTEPDKRPDQVAGQVADAVPQNWVDRYAPEQARPYLRLSRADRPIGTWLLFIPCLWGVFLAAMAGSEVKLGLLIWIVIVCGLGSFLMRGAGCTWNDITDRDIDAQVERTRSRPIPSGQVSPRNALIWMGVQCLVALILLLTLNKAAVLLAIAALGPVAVYPFAKRFTWWPQLFLGVAFNWGVLVGWTAYAGSLSAAPCLLYVAGIVWTLFYDTIYAHQDKEDDAQIGVRSTALLFGKETSVWLYRFRLMATYLAMVSLAFVGGSSGLAPVLVGVVGAVAFFLHLRWQEARLDINDPVTCMRLFRSNRDAGLLLAAGLLVAALV